MRKIILAAAVVAFAAVAGQAGAADIYAGSKMQPTQDYREPAANWAGLQVGIQGGWTIDQHHLDVSEAAHDLIDLQSLGGDGLSGRLSLEYEFGLGGDWYAGPRLYYGLSDDSFRASVFDRAAGIEVKGSDHYGGDVLVGRAVGSDRSTLLFGTIGYRWAKYDLSGTGELTTAGISDAGIDTTKTFQGVTFGGGVRHAFTSHLVGSVEYTRFVAGSEDWISDPAKLDCSSCSIGDKLTTDTVEVGLHYHF